MTPLTPSQRWGSLFAAVQESGLFADSKTFADAVPRIEPATILRDWREAPPADRAALATFVHDRFDLPPDDNAIPPDTLPLAEHIVALWPTLTRKADRPVPGGSLLPLPHRYVVPGGRFRELYYWDSYFTMLGLAHSGRQDLIEDMVADFGSLLDRYGRIPNGTRSYYLGRSHPPVFYLMAAMAADRSSAARRRRLDWMRIEHGFWMAGEETLAAPGEHRRVVRLADGSLLNRYWDDGSGPRDESWREDIALAAEAGRPADELWRDLRAAAESGWDFSSRWLGKAGTLATIRTTRLLPIDLNALLYGLERAIADEAHNLSEGDIAGVFTRRAADRRTAVERHLWNPALACYVDHDLDCGAAGDRLTAAAGFALFTGLADEARGPAVAAALRRLVRTGGLVTTEDVTGQQWDAPNGWAPLQWVAIAGLRRYGEADLARAIAECWTAMVEDCYGSGRQLYEKYDVEAGGGGGGGEYPLEIGFGWTNGVTLALVRERSD
jgi:alpha,alpha-trehalase